MSRKLLVPVTMFALLSALATTGTAQTPGAPAPGNTILIAQYECVPSELAKVDAILKDLTAPVLNKMVAEGKLIGWGVLGAYVGGPVNRTIYVWGKDPVSLMQARAQYLPEIQAKPGWLEVGRLCPHQQISLSNMIMSSGTK